MNSISLRSVKSGSFFGCYPQEGTGEFDRTDRNDWINIGSPPARNQSIQRNHSEYSFGTKLWSKCKTENETIWGQREYNYIIIIWKSLLGVPPLQWHYPYRPKEEYVCFVKSNCSWRETCLGNQIILSRNSEEYLALHLGRNQCTGEHLLGTPL